MKSRLKSSLFTMVRFSILCLFTAAIGGCGGGGSVEVVEVEPAPREEEPAEEMMEEPAEEPLAEEEPAEEVMAEEVPAYEEEILEFPEPDPDAVISIWLPVTGEDEELLLRQIDSFQEEFGVAVEVVFYPYSDFTDKILISLMAGVPPDIALLPYNAVAEFQEYGLLEPLNDLYPFIPDVFLRDAIASVRFNERYYGLPWIRSACSGVYQNLALFEAADYPAEAFYLMHYLTQYDRQLAYLDNFGWYPTRSQFYDEGTVQCITVEAVRLQPFQVIDTVALVTQRLENIGDLANAVDPYLSTAVVDVEGVDLSAAAVKAPLPEDLARELLQNGELMLGALFIDELGSIPELPAGDFAVFCASSAGGIEDAACGLVDGNFDTWQIPDPYLEASREVAPVGQPSSIVEAGSRKVCWRIDGLKFCLRVKD